MAISESSDVPERDWCVGIRDGDADAFAALFRKYYEPLCRFAFRQIQDLEAAEDAVQAVFASIWDGHARWAIRGSVRGYLYGAVRRQLFTRYREREVRARHEGEVGRVITAQVSIWARSDAALEADELRSALARAIEALPLKRREAFELSRRDGLSYAEIAQAMGISNKTVEIHIARAIAALRAALSAYLAALLLIQSR